MNFSCAPQKETEPHVTLVIGDMITWVRKGREIPRIDGYHFIDATSLTPALLRAVCPAIVLSSLVGENFDAIEIARKLGRMDYDGAYRILARNVPDLALVATEIRNVAPDLDVDMIDLAKVFPEL